MNVGAQPEVADVNVMGVVDVTGVDVEIVVALVKEGAADVELV